MWVVKIGGSLVEAPHGTAADRFATGAALSRRPLPANGSAPGQAGRPGVAAPGTRRGAGEPPTAALPRWLELIARLGGGRVAIVPGGGSFADAVRRAQQLWQVDDLAAHNMAVLAMAQTACLFRALCPALCPAHSDAEIRNVLHRGQVAVWVPMQALREQRDATTNWDTTSDSLALALARRLNAERLVLVKSRDAALDTGPDDWAASGLVDARFPTLAREASFPIDLVDRESTHQLRALLLGEVRLPV